MTRSYKSVRAVLFIAILYLLGSYALTFFDLRESPSYPSYGVIAFFLFWALVADKRRATAAA